MPVIDIQDAIYTKLIGDGTLSGLMGATTNDKRVYDEWPTRPIPVTDDKPVYCCIAHTNIGTPMFAMESPGWQVSVFGKKVQCLEAVGRVIAVLDKATLTALSHTVTMVKRGDTAHLYEEETRRHHYAVAYITEAVAS